MATEDRFKQAVITTLAKRAANRCSNPDCRAITSGPADDPERSVNVGEAAHIYGANLGSARYDPDMAPAERASLSNAIWLCGNCHRIIDDDEARFPSGLLFEWQKEHERHIAEIVGKAGAELRRRYEERHVQEYGRLSYLAARILTEKGDLWEYRLTLEVLRFEMKPILERWNALRRGLYMKPAVRIAKLDCIPWLLDRMAETRQIAEAFQELMNVEFTRSWGEPGQAGDEGLIISTCRLFAEMCRSCLDWEERVRFAAVGDIFRDVSRLFEGTVGHLIDEATKLPVFLTNLLDEGPRKGGEYRLSLTLTLPDGWNEAVEAALGRAEQALVADIEGRYHGS
jgi:hypothetical protein